MGGHRADIRFVSPLGPVLRDVSPDTSQEEAEAHLHEIGRQGDVVFHVDGFVGGSFHRRIPHPAPIVLRDDLTERPHMDQHAGAQGSGEAAEGGVLDDDAVAGAVVDAQRGQRHAAAEQEVDDLAAVLLGERQPVDVHAVEVIAGVLVAEQRDRFGVGGEVEEREPTLVPGPAEGEVEALGFEHFGHVDHLGGRGQQQRIVELAVEVEPSPADVDEEVAGHWVELGGGSPRDKDDQEACGKHSGAGHRESSRFDIQLGRLGSLEL